tara:strand:- start:552 stop:1253 length:702 start_codon:yes stop_codon:yes gene_type:complete
MNENLKYETYLLISNKKFIISVNTELDQKIYSAEQNFYDESEFELSKKLDHFLNDNVFKIEKKLKDFIKRISVILDLDIFSPIEISIKKKINQDEMNTKILNHLAYEAKNYCKKSLEHKKIIHMFIKNYKLNNQSFSKLPNDISGKNLSLDIKFITIDEDSIKQLEKIFKKYQISLHKVLNAEYLKEFLSQNETNIFSMAKKIAEGFNDNEVTFITKSSKKKGFFEKFFNFFN